MERPEKDPVGEFARGMGCPLGSFTKEVKTYIDETTFDLWLKRCHKANCTSSELLRDCLYILEHGKTPSELSADDRRALLQSEG
ncbi:hypothetical protein [Ramlibacter sp.]|uniref:hypothetical protein n=1 Tax=Ramlibacter sp. TaxID=1917967 RepID=UPI003D0EBF7F